MYLTWALIIALAVVMGLLVYALTDMHINYDDDRNHD
jgi:hypothetical protein